MDPKEQNQNPTPEPLPKTIPVPESLGGPEPERYIRTFAGDIDVVERGGTPGLSPLKPSAPEVEAPKPPEPGMTAMPAADLGSAMPVAEPKPDFKPPTPAAPRPADEGAAAVPLETYANDFRQHMDETHASTATVLAAEQDAGPHEEAAPEETPAPASHNAWYIGAGVLLVLVGGTGVFYAYSNYLSASMPVAVGPAVVAPIFVDSTDTVSGTGSKLMQAIEQSVGKGMPSNTVRLLALSATSSPNVLLSLGVPVPGIVARNITDSGTMAGVVNVSGNQSPFFIESVDLYSATFSGMLSWEPTMQRDLALLYPLYPAAAPVAATTTATSTPQATTTVPVVGAPSQAGFRDETVSNHDVRTYRDSQGRSILLYGYWNQSTLIIARDPAAFSEILARLATSRAQ